MIFELEAFSVMPFALTTVDFSSFIQLLQFQRVGLASTRIIGEDLVLGILVGHISKVLARFNWDLPFWMKKDDAVSV